MMLNGLELEGLKSALKINNSSRAQDLGKAVYKMYLNMNVTDSVRFF